MMKSKYRLAAALTALATAVTLALPGASQASTNGKKNTTLLLGAGAAYELLHHKTTNGLLLGAGTAYAYSRYNKSRKNDKNRSSSRYHAYRTTHRTYRRTHRRSY